MVLKIHKTAKCDFIPQKHKTGTIDSLMTKHVFISLKFMMLIESLT